MGKYSGIAAGMAAEQTGVAPEAQRTEPEQTSEGGYSSIVQGMKQEQENPPPVDPTIHRTISETSTPDSEAEIVQTAAEARMPADLARVNIAAAKASAERQQINDIAVKFPKTGEFFRDPINLAGARDDASELAEVERSLPAAILDEAIVDPLYALARTANRAFPTAGAITSDMFALLWGAMDVGAQRLEQITNMVSVGAEGLEPITGIETGPNYLKDMRDTQHEMTRVTRAYWDDHNLTTKSEDTKGRQAWGDWGVLLQPEYWIEQTGDAAASMIPIVVAHIASGGSIWAGGALGGTMEAGGLYNEMIENGESSEEAALATATGYGMVSTVLNSIGLGGIMASRTSTSMLMRLGKALAAGGLEGLTEWAEEPVSEYMRVLGEGGTFIEALTAAGEGAKNIDVFFGAMVSGGGTSFSNQRVDSQAGASRAEKFKEQQMLLAEKIAKTKTAERNPVLMEKFLNEQMGLQDQDIYIDAEVLLELQQTEGEAFGSFMSAMKLEVEGLQEAAKLGHAAKINLGSFHARVAPEVKTKLYDHIKPAPGAYSVSQVSEGLALSEDEFNERYVGHVAANEDLTAEIERLEQGIVAAGQSTEVAKGAVDSYTRMVTNFARLSGNKADTLRLLKKVKINDVLNTMQPEEVERTPGGFAVEKTTVGEKSGRTIKDIGMIDAEDGGGRTLRLTFDKDGDLLRARVIHKDGEQISAGFDTELGEKSTGENESRKFNLNDDLDEIINRVAVAWDTNTAGEAVEAVFYTATQEKDTLHQTEPNFAPTDIAPLVLPADTKGLLPSMALKGEYYNVTAAGLQNHLDTHGDGFMYRVIRVSAVENGFDVGNKKYKHRFKRGKPVKVHSYTTSFKDAQNFLQHKLDTEPNVKYLMYRIQPQDVADSFVAQVPSDRADGTALHIQSPLPASVALADVVYRNDEYIAQEATDDTRRMAEQRRGTEASRSRPAGEVAVRLQQRTRTAGAQEDYTPATDSQFSEPEITTLYQSYPDLKSAQRAAVDDFISNHPDGVRIRETLDRLQGSPWEKQAVESILIRVAMHDLMAGKAPSVESKLDEDTAGAIRKALGTGGAEGLWGHLMRTGLIGHASKPVNSINGSFINCSPSDACAWFCYATGGNYTWPVVATKSEAVAWAIEKDPVRAAEIVAQQYTWMPEFEAKKALRLLDKGDMTEGWITFIEELNKKEVRVQAFSKRPELLRRVGKKNLRLLSIDSGNIQLADDNPDLGIAFTYSGADDVAYLETQRERFEKHGGVILPIKVGKKTLPQSDIDALPAWAQPYSCPVNTGKVKQLGKNNPQGWVCTKCDKSGGTGCYFGQTTADTGAMFAPLMERSDIDERIADIKRLAAELPEELGSRLIATVDSISAEIRAGIDPEEESSSRSAAAESAAIKELFQTDTETDDFLTWAGTDAPVIEPQDINDFDFTQPGPHILQGYHGTTHTFDAFDATRGNVEGHFGRVNYFSSDECDAHSNYVGEGPDLTKRIERRAESITDVLQGRIDESEDAAAEVALIVAEAGLALDPSFLGGDADAGVVIDELALQLARKELSGGDAIAMEVFIKTEKPFVIGDADNPQWFTLQEIDEAEVMSRAADSTGIDIADIEADPDAHEEALQDARWEIMEETPNVLVDAINEVASQYDIDPGAILSEVYENFPEGEANATDIEEMLRHNETLDYDLVDEKNDLIGSHVVSAIIQAMGYDSIIMKNADKVFPRMNMNEGAAHIHVFHENRTNIKSVDNRGTYSSDTDNIYYQPVFHGTPHIWEPEPGFPHGRPRLDKIGTGEGAAAYGWGWYSAEEQNVARVYSEQLFDREKVDRINKQLSKIAKTLSDDYQTEQYGKYSDPKGYELKAEYDRLLVEKLESDNSLYELDLPDSVIPKLLDWDKPLSAQSPEVRKAIGLDSEYKDSERKWEAMGVPAPYVRKGLREERDSSVDPETITGAEYYHLFGSPREAARHLASIGIPGNKYLDQNSRYAAVRQQTPLGAMKDLVGKGPKLTSNYVIWDQDALDQIALLERNGEKLEARTELLQKEKTAGPKGSIQVTDDAYLMNLFERADASTPFHEFSHVYLLEMMNVVQSGAATPEMTKELTHIMAWLGVGGVEQIGREQHEQFARGFEAYLMEGKAPSAELIPAFKRYAQWLKAIYRHVKSLGVNLTPEIRGVFDRMLTVDAKVEATLGEIGLQPLTDSEMKALGVLPEDKEYLDKLYADAQDEAERSMFSTITKGIKNQIKGWRKDANEAADNNPMHQNVRAFIKSRGIDKATAISIFGPDIVERMPAGLDRVFKGSTDAAELDLGELQNYRAEAQDMLDAAREMLVQAQADRKPYLNSIRITDRYKNDELSELPAHFKTKRDTADAPDQAAMDVDGGDVQSFIDRMLDLENAVTTATADITRERAAVAAIDEEIAKHKEQGVKDPQAAGLHPDEAAYAAGFNSATELIEALEAYVPRKQEIANYIAQQKAEFENSFDASDFIFDTEEFAEYLGVMSNYTSGKMNEEAKYDARLESISNRKPGSAARGASQPVMARSAFKQYAKKLIRDMPLRDAVRADLFMAAVKKAAVAERVAIKKSDWAAAQKANEQMRLNFEMAKESRKIRLEMEKFERLGRRIKKASPKKVHAKYLGAALKLAERFGLVQLNEGHKPLTDKAGKIRDLLAASNDEMGADDFGFDLFLTDSTSPFNYKDMSATAVEELRTLLNALIILGRDAIDPRLTSLDLTLEEVKTDLVDATSTLKDKKVWKKRGKSFFGIDPTAWLRSAQDKARGAYADTYQMWAMIRILDGFTYYTEGEPGPYEKYFRDNLERAYARKSKDVSYYTPKIRSAFAKLFAGRTGFGAPVWINVEGVAVPRPLEADGRELDFEAIASAVLNMGNESNLLRLKEGYGWNDEQLNSLLNVLNDAELDAVQEIWDIFEEMRPEFFAASERINGVAPPRIEPRTFTTPSGKVMRGGYVPAYYEHQNVKAAELDEKQLMKESANAGHQRASVNARASKSRAVSAGGMPIRLDFSGIARQFDYNLQYTAFAETIRDLSRVLNNQEVADAIADKVGPEWLPVMRIILSKVATPGVEANTKFFGRLMRGMGTAASKYILGGNRSVGIKQTFSIPAIYVEGGSWHKGLGHILGSPRKMYDAWQQLMEESPAMRQRMEGGDIDREVVRQRKKLIARTKLSGVPTEIIDGVLFAYIRFFDGIAVFPAYYGTKQNMERKYGPGQRAIRETEKIIFDTQPMSRNMDLSALQLDRNGLSRLLTFFSGFVMKFENRKRVYVRGFLEGKIPLGQFMFHVLLERMAPPMFMNLLFTLGAGDDPELDDVLWDMLMYQVCGFPGVRELAVLGSNTIRRAYDPDFQSWSVFNTPLLTPVKAMERNMNTLAGWFQGDIDSGEAALAAIDVGLALKGIPAVKMYEDMKESARQFERSDGFDAWFKLLFKPDPEERE